MDESENTSLEDWLSFRKALVHDARSRVLQHNLPSSKTRAEEPAPNEAVGNPSIESQGRFLVVELFGSDPNGRKMIAWGRRIGCRDAGHGYDPGAGVYTKLLVDFVDKRQHDYLMELVDNPVGLRAINPADPVELGEKR